MPHLNRTLTEHVLYPAHVPRTPSALYVRNHHLMVVVQDRPCLVCGVRNSTLHDSAKNPTRATAMETHHRLIEDSLANAIDLGKFNERVRPGLLRSTDNADKYSHEFTQEEMLAWIHGDIDNLWVICLPPSTPVLMANGRSQALASIRVGDSVIGHDRRAHSVSATTVNHYHGNLVSLDGVAMTPNHRVLTRSGWKRADAVQCGEFVYRIEVFTPEVIRVGGVQPKVLKTVVSPVMVNMVDALRSAKAPAKVLLHDPTVLHDGTSLALFPDRAPSVATASNVPAQEPGRPLTGQAIEPYQAASIGAIPSPTPNLTGLFFPSSAAEAAMDRHTPPVLQRTLSAHTSIRACDIAASSGFTDEETVPADDTGLLDTGAGFALLGRWCSVKHISLFPYESSVHDIEVTGSHSFIAGGMAVHNCNVHHRSKLVGIHAITGPIWSVQDLLIEGFDLTGFTAYSPAEAAALTDLPVTAGKAQAPEPLPPPS